MEKQEINKILEEFVENKKIDDWGLEKYSYWDGMPYLIIEKEKIFLCSTFFFAGSLCVNTIYDCKTKRAVKSYINFIINNSDLLKKYYINDVKQLHDIKERIEWL